MSFEHHLFRLPINIASFVVTGRKTDIDNEHVGYRHVAQQLAADNQRSALGRLRLNLAGIVDLSIGESLPRLLRHAIASLLVMHLGSW